MYTESTKNAEDRCTRTSGSIPSGSLKFAGNGKRMTQQEFSETCREWIAEQNRDFEMQGLWCDGLLPF